ncbi:hypothetical protein [Marinovum sp. KMM 9989]
MKKFIVSAAFVTSMALPAVSQQADTSIDPFVSTQGETTTLVILGGAVGVVGIVALTGGGGSSSSTGTN